MGCLPATFYLVTRNSIVIGEFSNLFDFVSLHFNITMNKDGFIYLNGIVQHPSYNIRGETSDSFSIKEAMQDWVKCHLNLPIEYRVYRVLK